MNTAPSLVVLGIAQDGGHPQAGCQRPCCAPAWMDRRLGHLVASLGLIDPGANAGWLLDASPDLPEQLYRLQLTSPGITLGGLLLTHAHMGHYTGLLNLGREVMGANGVPVWAMPRMRAFLAENGPWELMVRLANINLRPLEDQQPVSLSPRLTVTPFAVPHRDEYSETVGFIVRGPSRSALYLPDIDKWERWSTPIEAVLQGVDLAFVDGTFYGPDELAGRSMAEVPHPFITETITRLAPLPASERAKVHFIHLNHTNPALDPDSDAAATITAAGMSVAVEGAIFPL